MADPGNAASDCRRHVVESFYSIIALVFILVACVELGDASTVVDVYRLIQYDISGAPFGSRVASINHHATSSLFAQGSDLSRTVVILPLRELNETFIREYIEQGKPLGGLLLLLPQFFRSENSETVGGHDIHDKEKMKEILFNLEQKLIHSTIQYPVYFAFEDENLDKVLADIKRNDAVGQPATATTGGYKLIVTSPTPKKLASPTITNIQGWLLSHPLETVNGLRKRLVEFEGATSIGSELVHITIHAGVPSKHLLQLLSIPERKN